MKGRIGMAQRKFYISAKRLVANDACEHQVERFIKTFGEGKVLLTDANFEKAVAAGLSIWWFALMYLPRDKYREVTRVGLGSSKWEPQAFWELIKAHMKADKAERPAEWYE